MTDPCTGEWVASPFWDTLETELSCFQDTEGLGVEEEEMPQSEEGSHSHFPQDKLQVHPGWSSSPEDRSGDPGVISEEEKRARGRAWHEPHRQESLPPNKQIIFHPVFHFLWGSFPWHWGLNPIVRAFLFSWVSSWNAILWKSYSNSYRNRYLIGLGSGEVLYTHKQEGWEGRHKQKVLIREQYCPKELSIMMFSRPNLCCVILCGNWAWNMAGVTENQIFNLNLNSHIGWWLPYWKVLF